MSEEDRLRKEISRLQVMIAEEASKNAKLRQENKDLKKECEYQRNGWLNACTTSTLQIEKLDEAKSIIRKLLQDIEIAENEYKFTSQSAIKAEKFLGGGEE